MKSPKSLYFRDVKGAFPFDDWMIEDGVGVYALAAAFELAGIRDGECMDFDTRYLSDLLSAGGAA